MAGVPPLSTSSRVLASSLVGANLVIVLGMMQVAKKVPFEDPNVLNIVRGIYLFSNFLIAVLYYTIYLKINKKKDLTTLKYVEPAPMGSSEEPKLVTTTIYAYDNQQLRNAFRAQLMGIVHHPLKGALEGNLTKIHIFGQPASGDLKRPFKQAAGLMAGLQNGAAQSDKKAVEAAEKAGRGGAKEE
ncbi:unnamed protein product [Parascedosporium putredinis]|uniref:Inorganic phosphate transporter n=1 Tax=Parascedosporium putredinis TaxID=1442378 RepID=A0A9P1MD42_9PEZI|nr:unnamed protein product [Parascedosporium putredinis]CAI7999696.1 unnamed protein product [Parascedosporium putredinis]